MKIKKMSSDRGMMTVTEFLVALGIIAFFCLVAMNIVRQHKVYEADQKKQQHMHQILSKENSSGNEPVKLLEDGWYYFREGGQGAQASLISFAKRETNLIFIEAFRADRASRARKSETNDTTLESIAEATKILSITNGYFALFDQKK